VSAYIPAALRREVAEFFGNVCAYCRTAENLSVAIFEIEHITPRSVDGETTFENLCLSCPTCNRYKADRMAVVDPTTQSKVALFHPQRDAWEEHFAWNDDASELIGLTVTGRATIVALRMNRPQLVRVRKMWVAMGEHPPDVDSSNS
jgi:hypothetical protein